MPARRLPGLGVRLRRGRRTDLTAVRALLGRTDRPGAQRFDRRVVTDLGGDVYVAEDAAGGLVGVVAVAYVRSLREGRWTALLDVLRARDVALATALLECAAGRARARGCTALQTLAAAGDAGLAETLGALGWQPAGQVLGLALGPAD